MAKSHYVYKAKRWWRFRDREHHNAFVLFCHGKGPKIYEPAEVRPRRFVFPNYRPNH